MNREFEQQSPHDQPALGASVFLNQIRSDVAGVRESRHHRGTESVSRPVLSRRAPRQQDTPLPWGCPWPNRRASIRT